MANVLTAIQRTILVKAVDALRNFAVLPQRVYRGYKAGGEGEMGDVINVPVPPTVGTSAVTPANVTAQAGDNTPTKIQVPLDNWRKADPFYLTDKEISHLMNPDEHFLPMYMEASVIALAEYVNAQLFASYKGVYGYTGTAGTAPFGGSTAADAANARQTLNEQKAPLRNRTMIIDPAAGASAGINPQLTDWDKTNDATARIEASMGRKHGFDWFEDQQVPYHTAGTITTGLIAKASTAQALDLATIVATTAASTGEVALVVGDIITIAGHSQTYAVTAAVTEATAATDVNLLISPGLQTALTGSEAITVKASHRVNLAMQENAIALASVPLVIPAMSKRNVETIVDPVTGLSLRLEFVDQSNQSHWELQVLFGTKLVRPELITRVAG
jgi:hypothetical protein